MMIKMLLLTILVMMSLCPFASAGTVYQYGGAGSAAFWSTEPTWQVLNAETAYKSGTIGSEITFAGNASYPGAYWAITSNYIYFRVRTEYSGAVTYGSTFSDTVMVMIDTKGYNYNSLSASWGPDFAFAWDTAASPYSEHGLEMQARSDTGQGSWGAIRFDDLDTLGNKQLVPSGTYSFDPIANANTKKYSSETTKKGPDFGLADGSGYVRTVDGMPYDGTNSTFIDFAISIAYLDNIAPQLMDNPIWNIQFGSINQGNDHALLDDVAGSSAMTGTGYAGTIDTQNGTTLVPEPSTILLLGFGLVAVAFTRRKKG